jgi:aconitate hydratase 2/2-methylisocitrate dehydratase
LDLLKNRIPPGVDEAAYVKAAFLTAVAEGKTKSPLVSPELATELLGTMQGGYNIASLVSQLDSPTLGSKAADALSKTILMFEAFHDVEEKVT